MKHAVAKLAGGLLFPFVNGYMSAKYLKQMHVSQYKGYITLVYARADAVAIVIKAEEARQMNRDALGAWFHAQVADLNPDEVIPQLKKFRKAAQRALDLVHGVDSEKREIVPRIVLPAPAV